MSAPDDWGAELRLVSRAEPGLDRLEVWPIRQMDQIEIYIIPGGDEAKEVWVRLDWRQLRLLVAFLTHILDAD